MLVPVRAWGSPACAEINGKSGTLATYQYLSLTGEWFNVGDKVTFTTSGGNGSSLVQYIDSDIQIDNAGVGTISTSATHSQATAAAGIQNAYGPDGIAYSVTCASAAAPPAASISPAAAPYSTQVAIAIAGDWNVGAVRFGTFATAYSVTRGGLPRQTTITAVVPDGTGTVPVVVTTDAGDTSGTFTFSAPTVFASAMAVARDSTNNPIVPSTVGATLLVVGSAPAHGTATVTSGTTISYTPAAGYAGTDSFTYMAGNAAGLSTPETVSITVLAAVPGAPTIGTATATATAGDGQATVSFTAPADDGGAAITGYTVTSSPGGITASGSGSPITVTGLGNGTAYTFTVAAINSEGVGPASAASNSVTPQTAQTITNFIASSARPVFAAGGTFTVSATGGAPGNPVVFASTTASVCTVSGSTVTMVSAGTCSLTAGQAADANQGTAPQATLDVVIAAAAPTISWIGALQKIVGEGHFELPAPTSSSSGTFTYASSNAEVATVSGRTVTIVGPGVTTLTATQAAAGGYTAGSVSVTLTVAARPDPTRDRSVVDGLQAQVDASVRFAAAQQDNIRDRLRQLRAAGGANAPSNDLTFNVAGRSGPGPSLPMAGNALNGARLPAGWGVWTAGSITLDQRSRTQNADRFDFRSDGISVGVDRRLGERTVFGVAGGFAWGDTDFGDRRSDLSGDQRSLSAYALWRGGEHVFVDGLLGRGRLNFDIARWSEVADARAMAVRKGDQAFGSLELGYEHRSEDGAVTGYGRFDASRTALDAYRERGLALYDLAYREQTIDSSSLAVGMEGRYARQWGSHALRPFWSVEYRHALRNDGDATINYVVQPVASDYTLGLRSYNENAFALGAGFDVELARHWQLSLSYRHERTNETHSNAVALRLMFGGGGPPTEGGTMAPAVP